MSNGLKKRRSIIVFFEDNENHRGSWWHFSKRYVHVGTIMFDDSSNDSVWFFNGDMNGIQISKPKDWLMLASHMIALQGAVEVYAIESTMQRKRIGGLLWYWCHTLARDLAHLPFGFVLNPWHLRRKIVNYKGDEFRIVAHYDKSRD